MHLMLTGPALVVAGMLACASFPAVASAQDTAALPSVTVHAKKPTPNRDAIAREELSAMRSGTLFDVVTLLRPHWMRGPAMARSSIGLSSGGAVMAGALPGTVVYVDGREFGPLTELRTLPAETAEKLCYYALNRAQGRFGLRVQSPVVEVFTRSSSLEDDPC